MFSWAPESHCCLSWGARLSPLLHQQSTACVFRLLLWSPAALSLAFSHSQTTLVLIKPRGLTFSPRYLECCTKSILRPCQLGNKTLLFPFWDFFLPLFCKQGEYNKLNLAFPPAQQSSLFYTFMIVEITFKDTIQKK